MIAKRIILFFSIILSVASVFAQKAEHRKVNKYTIDFGLASNYVYQIIQDEKGFIWIGTEEGLNKFDGISFTEFTTNRGRYSLSHNRTQALILAPDGNVWIGTSDGINIYDYKSDSIIQVRTNTAPLKLVYNDITCFAKSKNNKILWIGTYGNGVHYFDTNKKLFTRFNLPQISGVKEALLVMSILEDDNKRLWIGTQDNGLYKYDLTKNSFEICTLTEQNLNVSAIYQDSYRRVWIGTNKGCYTLNETTNQFEQVTYPAELATNAINVFREDKSGNLWIGSDAFLMSFSVRSFSKTEKFAYQTVKSGESSYTLNCPLITSILADRDNNIWIGTVWGGLNMMQGIQSKFKLFEQEPDEPFSLPKTPVTGICAFDNDNILLSTNTKGIYKMSLATSEFRKFSTSADYSGYNFQTLQNDQNGNIWLGTFKRGAIVLNKNGVQIARIEKSLTDTNSLVNNDVRYVYQAKNNKIWLATQRGISVVNPDNFQVEKNIRLYNNTGIRVIKEDNSGRMWIGTYGAGVVTINPATDEVDYHPTPFNLVIVYDILIDGDKIWIATHGQGVFEYDLKTKKENIFSEKEGLATNFTRSILRDNKGNIWLGTGKGISKINTQNNEIQNFNSQDDVQSQGFYEHSTLKLPNGEMLFGGYVGLNMFNPLNVTKSDQCPPVVFTKLSVFNQTVSPSESRPSSLKQNISIADKIKLAYNQSVFTIEFVGLNYNAAQKIQYAYLLEGADTHWNYIGNQNNITFRNLAAGKYTLKVKASSPDGVWSDNNIASIIVVIKPPFWFSWWAYLLYIIIVGVILYFVWKFVTLRITSENNLRIERAKLEKEEELHQEKLRFFTNISHEFRTPLTLLIGPLQKLQNDETNESKKNNIALMLRNAKRLLVMVNQLLDFRKAEKGQMKLNVKYADIIVFIKEIINSYDELKQNKKIELDFLRPDGRIMCWFDPEFIDKCLFNLLSNSFKFTPDKGKITVSVYKKTNENHENYIELAVTDNGSGIPANEINRIFDYFYVGKENRKMQPGSGIGLNLTKSLVDLHHGNISAESVPNKKTTFTITFPADESGYLPEDFAGEKSVVSRQINGEYDTQSTIYEKTFAEAHATDKKRILLVEDNPEIRSYIVEILGEKYLVDEADNGVAGLKMANENEFNLIITDVMMPEMDGIEMCKRLKSSIETDHIPVIMLTAKSSIENKIEGLNVGADSYISKPFHPEHLLVRVEKLIEQRDLFQQRFSRKILLENKPRSDEKAVSPDELFLNHAISCIFERMTETGFNGDVLASDLNISRMGLHRKIKALTGQSTGEFIRNVRLKKASELLLLPGKNISEVCYDVGFNSPSYFTTCFTEMYNMTPSEFAKKEKRT